VKKVLFALDFVLRLAFFAVAPPLIVLLTALFPMGGAIINIALGLFFFLFAEALREHASKTGLLAGFVRAQLRFDEYYREHPPKPFLFYVFYPLLFPYWLIVKKARREFWMFKGYTLLSVAILVITTAIQYVRYWPPDLGLQSFAPIFGLTLLLEALVVLALLMPISTTVITYHLGKRRALLFVLLFVGMASTGYEIAKLALKRDPIVSVATRFRVQQRTDTAKDKAKKAQRAALLTALPLVLAGKSKIIEGDGKVEGEPLDRAHDALLAFYKEDEAFAFDLWAAPRKSPQVLVLYVESYRGRPAVWLAVDAKGKEIRDQRRLPRGALDQMKHAADN
jgi:hypothetical protein